MSIYHILTLLAVAVVCVFNPLLLKECNPVATKKSLLYKQICATMFLLIGVLGMLSTQSFGIYPILIVCGLAASWWGDFFLHLNGSKVYFLIGGTFFFSAHIIYTVAINRANAEHFAQSGFMNVYEVLALMFIWGVVISYTIIKEFKIGKPVILGFIYLCAISTMTVKAWGFAFRIIAAGEIPVIAAVLLIIGSTLFLLSDITLALINFGNYDPHGRIKDFNLWSYFIGQCMIGATTFFIK